MGPAGGTFQLARVFGIRIGASASWFLFLFVAIYVLSGYFHSVLGGARATAYAVGVGSALAFFASLVAHELGHALTARRLGYEIDGIDLWFFGGVSRMRGQVGSPQDELKIASAGPVLTLLVVVACAVVGTFLADSHRFLDVALARPGVTTTPALALLSWVASINALLLVFNLVPGFPLDGGRIAHAAIWRLTGDRDRGTRVTGRAGQGFALILAALGVYGLFHHDGFGPLTIVLALILYQAAQAAVAQGAFGQRIQGVTVGDIMDRAPPTLAGDMTLLDAQERFERHTEPWFAAVDDQDHFLGLLSAQRVQSEIAEGRPALTVAEVLDDDPKARIGVGEPVESLLANEGLRRRGALVAVDGDGVLLGVVTVGHLRRVLKPAQG